MLELFLLRGVEEPIVVEPYLAKRDGKAGVFCFEGEGLKFTQESVGPFGMVFEGSYGTGMYAYRSITEISYNLGMISFPVPVVGPGGLAVYVRWSRASCTAFRDSSKSEPVTINFLHPMSTARCSTSSRSSSWAFLPW